MQRESYNAQLRQALLHPPSSVPDFSQSSTSSLPTASSTEDFWQLPPDSLLPPLSPAVDRDVDLDH